MAGSVLIIEGTFFIRSLLKKTVQSISTLNVTDVYDSGEAKQELAKNRFDLIILDLNLYGEDGLEFLVELRKTYPDVPVIVLSSKDTVLKEAEEAKAHALLSIPVDLEQLRTVIRDFLSIG